MNDFESKLNDLLVRTLRSILKVEEKTLCGPDRINLSISEMHMLEAIGREKEKEVTISMVSQLMEITLPSATVAVNKLVEKGYLVKKKCANDGRVIYVLLTSLGEKMNRVHSYFHKKLAREIAREMEEEEKEVLIKSIEKINNFFIKTIKT